MKCEKSCLGSLVKCLSFLLFIVSIATVDAEATTWYVATNGNDSRSCSQAQSSSSPKQTIAGALACVGAAGTESGAGDTVQVAAGSYSSPGNAGLVDLIPSGSSEGSRFVLTCQTDFACIINIADDKTPSIGFNAASHYITIQGFVWSGGGGGYMSSKIDGNFHHITFLNNEYRDAPYCFGCLLQAGGASDILIKGNIIHNVGQCPGYVGYCHGIYASSHTQRWVIEDNQFYNTHGYGIHVYSDDPDSNAWPQNYIIQRNITHNNGDAGVNGAGIIVYGSGHQIYNNVTYSNAYYGILVRSSNTSVYNNTISNNPAAGIYSESGSLSCMNNLIIGNGTAIQGPCSTNAGNITSGSAASLFVNAAGGDYSLAPGSSAIDAGVNLSSSISSDLYGNPRPQGGGFDVGAIEYGQLAATSTAASAPPAPPANLRVVP